MPYRTIVDEVLTPLLPVSCPPDGHTYVFVHQPEVLSSDFTPTTFPHLFDALSGSTAQQASTKAEQIGHLLGLDGEAADGVAVKSSMVVSEVAGDLSIPVQEFLKSMAQSCEKQGRKQHTPEDRPTEGQGARILHLILGSERENGWEKRREEELRSEGRHTSFSIHSQACTWFANRKM